MQDRIRNLEKVKCLILDSLGEQVSAILVYGSTLNSDFCALSDYDILVVLEWSDYETCLKLRKIVEKLEEEGIYVDINSHVKSDLPENRQEMYWHNNRSLFVQQEMSRVAVVLYGENPFKEFFCPEEEMLQEAVRTINSFNYQARKFLTNKELSTQNKIYIIKWCLYGSLYILAVDGIFKEDRREALGLFIEKYQPEISPLNFLETKLTRPAHINSQDLKLAFRYLQYLDRLIWQKYQDYKQSRQKTVEYKVKTGETLVGVYLNGDKNLILAPGLPHYIDKHHEIVRLAKKFGVNLFMPRYMGTYESGGEFSLENCVKSLDQTITLVKKGAAKELYAGEDISWGNKNVAVLGFSFGALPAALMNEKVDKKIFGCPFIDIKFHEKNSSYEILDETLNFVEKACQNLYRIDKEKFISELRNCQIPEQPFETLIIKATEDSSIPEEEIDLLIKKCKKYELVEKPGGHSLDFGEEIFRKILAI